MSDPVRRPEEVRAELERATAAVAALRARLEALLDAPPAPLGEEEFSRQRRLREELEAARRELQALWDEYRRARGPTAPPM